MDKRTELNDELRTEYDETLLKNGIRGKYVERYAAGTNIIKLDPDVAAAFPNEEAVKVFTITPSIPLGDINMSTSNYPNRDALRKALDIYLDAMHAFVVRCLNQIPGKTAKGIIKDICRKDVKEIECKDIAYLFRNYWDPFKKHFNRIDRYYEARSVVQLIVEGRNRASHQPWDLDLEFTRTQLSMIAEILEKIDGPNKQREVEEIREDLFSDDTKERLEETEKRLMEIAAEKIENGKKTRDSEIARTENVFTIDIQTEKHPEVGHSEFWAPIRNGEFGELFAGKPVLIRNEGFISKIIRGVEVCLNLNAHQCYIRLWLYGKNRSERRDKIKELFQESIYDCEDKDTPKGATLIFPVMNKGKNDRDDWDEIREKLVAMGTDIYNALHQISALTPTQESGRNIESSKTPPVLKGELEQTSSTPSTEKKGPAFVAPPPDLTDDEKTVFNAIEVPSSHIDTIVRTTQLPISQISSLLLVLELKGAIQQLPGKQFTKGSV